MRRAVFLQLFFKWDGDLYRKHFDSVYRDDSTPMADAQRAAGHRGNDLMHKATEIALGLMAQKPETVG